MLLVLVAVPFTWVHKTSAAALSQVFVRFDHMQTSTATTGTVCAKAASTATEASVVVAFPTGYTLGIAATFTVGTTNTAWPTGGTAWPSIATATSVSSQNVTFPSGDLTVGTLYCFNWINTAAVTTSASATSSNLGSVTTQTSVPAAIDTAQYTTATITNEQIAVSATVPSSFSFALSSPATDQLGTLSTLSVTPSPTPRSATISTNAKNGWMVWAKDLNTGLTSASAGATIPATTYSSSTPTTLVAGTAGYNTGVTASHGTGTGAITVDPGFAGSTATGGGLSPTLRTIATSNGTGGGDTVTLTNNVAISAVTPAATDYADTITVIGAGLF